MANLDKTVTLTSAKTIRLPMQTNFISVKNNVIAKFTACHWSELSEQELIDIGEHIRDMWVARSKQLREAQSRTPV